MVIQNQHQDCSTVAARGDNDADEHIFKVLEMVMQRQQHHQVETHCKHGNTGPMATVSQLNGGKFLQLRP